MTTDHLYHARLAALGWLRRGGDLRTALSAYQRFFGVRSTGLLCAETAAHLATPRFCRHPDVPALSQNPKRTASRATWSLAGALPGVQAAAFKQAIQWAFDQWTAVAGCSAAEAQPGQTPDLVISTGAIDGPLGILAETELPPGHAMTVDNAEQWILTPGPVAATSQIDLCRVLCHEIGHFWGMQHIQTGNLLAPIYNPAVWTPQAGDAQVMAGMYGAASAPGLPAQPGQPTPTPGYVAAARMQVLDSNGRVTHSFRLTQES